MTHPASTWDPKLYEDRHAFVWKYGVDLLPLLDPKPGEQILDVGCGTGQLTAKIAESGATVTGLDSSGDMIAKARANHREIQFLHGDISSYSAPYQFDAVFSNATLHWVTDAEAAVRSIAKALRPGGRFVAEFGGHGNLRTILKLTGLPNPWYFPAIGEYAALLDRNNLETHAAFLIDRPTRLDDPVNGMRHWFAMFGQSWKLDDEQMAAIEEKLHPKLFHDGHWHVDYRRIRVQAVKLKP